MEVAYRVLERSWKSPFLAMAGVGMMKVARPKMEPWTDAPRDVGTESESGPASLGWRTTGAHQSDPGIPRRRRPQIRPSECRSSNGRVVVEPTGRKASMSTGALHRVRFRPSQTPCLALVPGVRTTVRSATTTVTTAVFVLPFLRRLLFRIDAEPRRPSPSFWPSHSPAVSPNGFNIHTEAQRSALTRLVRPAYIVPFASRVNHVIALSDLIGRVIMVCLCGSWRAS
ncbi:hypothetical protein B0J18DRAFT_303030 [Chaetomium sp. MPI-SDFR-AT-0129]|nr:hypothetical protein B0J18DRAFT_303030 [Chaetomium sp. MPI-SDFR-AT-0129]